MFRRKQRRTPPADVLPGTMRQQPLELPQGDSGRKSRPFAPPNNQYVLPSLRTLKVPDVNDVPTWTVPETGETALTVHGLTSTPLNPGVRRMKVIFTDPSTSDCLEVNVSPDKTAAQCIEALKSNGHLGPGSYQTRGERTNSVAESVTGRGGCFRWQHCRPR